MRSRSATAARRRTSSWLRRSCASPRARRSKLMFISPTDRPTTIALTMYSGDQPRIVQANANEASTSSIAATARFGSKQNARKAQA
ncbi:hypothetical protein NB689_003430 [Xanthomonas sacchari]|nr:hypothetical protein [Xanthomonas sacchari]MCW0450600.1 hypothetical protein [Xanthomonas sacchari]